MNDTTLHLFVTDKCPNSCPLCCNKEYNIDAIPVVTVRELQESKIVCITGGDPLEMPFGCHVLQFIHFLRNQYRNIEKLYLYSSGIYFGNEQDHLRWKAVFPPRMFGNSRIDGFSWGPKSTKDWNGLINFQEEYKHLHSHDGIDYYEPECDNIVPTENRLYVFPEWRQTFEEIIMRNPDFCKNLHANIIFREWQSPFIPAPNTIFRRLPILLSL